MPQNRRILGFRASLTWIVRRGSIYFLGWGLGLGEGWTLVVAFGGLSGDIKTVFLWLSWFGIELFLWLAFGLNERRLC